jgi:apolipoprotein N-acyltransferase
MSDAFAPSGEPKRPTRRREFPRELGAATLTAGLWAATLHPIALPWLAWVALLPWLLRARAPGRTGRGEIVAWVLAQFALHVYVLWWTTACAPPLAVVVPFLGVPFSWLTATLVRAGRRRGAPDLLVVPGALVLVEVLRDAALKGLTWSSLGYAIDVWPAALQLASVGRVHLPALVVVAANVLLADLWTLRSAPRPRNLRLAGLAVLLLAAHAVGLALRPGAFEPGPRTAGLQPNIPQYRKSGDVVDHLKTHDALLQTLDPQRLDLLIYSETSFPTIREPQLTLTKLLETPASFDAARGRRIMWGDVVLPREDQTTILGVPWQKRAAPGSTLADRDGDGFNEWNVAWVVRGRRPTDEIYRKRELAPFGEFMPVGPDFPAYGTIEALTKKALGHVPDLIPGDAPLFFGTSSPGGPRVGSVNICFEIVFPRYFREAVHGGADFVINLSNDAWFLDSAELDLVDQATRWRAVECGRSVFRVSNSGISTAFAPDGTRLGVVEDAQGRRKEVRGVLSTEIPVAKGRTVYVRWGDWPWAAVGLGWLVAVFLRPRRPATPALTEAS